MWGGWLLVHFVVFSLALNIFHPYYASALAPPFAVLAAAGLVTCGSPRQLTCIEAVAPSAVAGPASLLC